MGRQPRAVYHRYVNVHGDSGRSLVNLLIGINRPFEMGETLRVGLSTCQSSYENLHIFIFSSERPYVH